MTDFLRELADAAARGTLRPIAKGVAVANIILFCAGLRYVWPDVPPSGYALASLTGALLGVAEMELGGRLLLGERGLMFDLSEGGWGTAIAVFGLVYVLTIGLFAYEWHDQRVEAAVAAQGRAQQEAYDVQMRALSHIHVPPRPDHCRRARGPARRPVLIANPRRRGTAPGARPGRAARPPVRSGRTGRRTAARRP